MCVAYDRGMMKNVQEPGSHSIDITGIPLLERLTPQAREVLERHAMIREYQASEVLWREGTPAGAVHIVLAGEVRVVSRGDGRQRVVHRETRGGTLGDVAVFSDDCYPATAIATRRVSTLVLTRDTVHAIIAADPAFAMSLMKRLALRVRHVLGVIDRMTNWSVQARLARYLIERGAAGTVFTLGMTQQELAEELGTVREVIVRTLGELRDAGHIESSGKGRYRIRSVALLKQIAGNE